MTQHFSPAINRLISALGKLPGIGRKGSQRLAYHILGQDDSLAKELADAINNAREMIHLCPICCDLTETDPCEICSSSQRDRTTICVVESPRDIASIERIQEYNGLYHVLHGAISPMRDIGPEQIKLKELLIRLQDSDEVKELVLATNPTVEGEATALYIAKLLKGTDIKTTRLAHGIPMGSDLEYADEVTLMRAFIGRQDI
ncbi:MAG TPA: recombination protein RecR [Clostridiaceae bacterium]|nr:recombination protein RecR [Clostridiaceae bacterium]